MMSRQRKVALLVLLGLIALLCLTDGAFAAQINGISAGQADQAVTEGIGTFWAYILFIIPIIGVAAIIFGLWNAITTDRGQSSSVVSGLTAVGVGFVMVFVPAMIISGYATSGSEAASLREWGSSLIVAPPIDWGSPITLFIILGSLRWRLTQTARRRRHVRGDVAHVSH